MHPRRETYRATISVPTEMKHIEQAALSIRHADRIEVLASHGLDARQAILASWYGSDFARTLFIDDRIAAIFGVRSLPDGAAQPWVLTTDLVDRRPVAFWRASKHVVRELRGRYPLLGQCIDARHEQALRWVSRLGFEVDKEPHRCGVLGLWFHRAILRR